MFKDLILKNRSVRHYEQSIAVTRETLLELVELARLSGSASNRQSLKYMLSWEPEKNALVYKNIGLAGQPPEGERPSAYIIILGDTEIAKDFGVDPGIVAQSMLLGAVERGLGGCMIGMINRKGLHIALNIPKRYEICLVICIGKPKEKFVIENLEKKDDLETRGWWDERGVRHVPKRKLEDLIVQ
ncbi:MAG: nitroreductase [Chloroflexi bacterium RBG_13_46_9]|nr:MAG: nitroreductase [Chloroflexi bacterium RBG_13_46_9]